MGSQRIYGQSGVYPEILQWLWSTKPRRISAPALEGQLARFLAVIVLAARSHRRSIRRCRMSSFFP
jgi:hypothetical protein